MAHAFVVGDVLVESEEFFEKVALGTVGRFLHDMETPSGAEATIHFSRGTVKATDLLGPPPKAIPTFQPVGLGRPLSLEILAVYTGDVPRRWFGLAKSDLLVTSAVKALTHLNAAPRAVNQLVAAVDNHRHVQPSALSEGSPIIYYTPSLVNERLTVTVQLIADSFDKTAFQHLEQLLKTAGAVPLFVPAQGYLLVGSYFTKIFGKLGEILFESRPFLHEDIDLAFDTPGMPAAVSRHIVVYDYQDRTEFESNYTVRPVQSAVPSKTRIALVNRETGKEYAGDAPYAILSLDGRTRQGLDDFTPRFASAALLERFLGTQDAGGQAVQTLESAMQLYNDFVYHQRAKSIKQQLDDLDEEASDYAEQKAALETLLHAYVGNITQALFKADLADGKD
jgi:hypothetical protein